MSIKSLFEDIADAIRETSGSSDTYTPAEMPQAIRNFSSIFQTKNLSTTIEGQTTVEGCLSALSEKTDLTYNTVSGNPVSFTTDSSGISRNTIVTLEPIQSRSGDPSPTNVRPISGYDSISITSSGKNMWHGGNVSGTTYSQWALRLPAGTYTVSAVCTSSDTDSSTCLVLLLNSNGGSLASAPLTRGSRASATFTLSSESSFIRFYSSDNYDHSYGDTYSFTDIQIEKGSTATTYDAPTTTTINTPSTIYGGDYDLEKGELTVKYALVDLGSLTWSAYDSNNRFYSLLGAKPSATIYCSGLKPVTTAPASINDLEITVYSNGSLYARDTSSSGPTTFKTNVSGVKLAYELKTPYTIQLEPHLLPLLSGANTVSTNGTSISVTYRNGLVARVDDFSAVADAINTIAKILENSNNT